jgi:hypothetical protein
MCTFLRIFTTVSSDLPFVPRMSTVKEVVSAVADDEQYAHNGREIVAGGNQREQFVTLLHRNLLVGGKDVEQHAQHQEKQDDEELRNDTGNHVLL